jgi:sacsin
VLPEKLTLEDVEAFMTTCVAEDESLTDLKVRRMTLDELPDHLPKVLDEATLPRYKQFYEKWASELATACCQPLPIPTGGCTLQKAKDLFKREPLFTAVYSDDFFVHPLFEEFEKKLKVAEARSERDLDMETFKACARRLDPKDVSNAKKVFLAFKETLPNRVTKQPQTWRELDEIRFIPRRMDTARRLPELPNDEPGLEIPPQVARLDAVIQPVEVVRPELEAIAWSQRACFETPPGARVYEEYPDLGRPGFSEVVRLFDLHCRVFFTQR